MNAEQAKNNIQKVYTHYYPNGGNQQWVQAIRSIIDAVDVYLESNFWSNHFGNDDPINYDFNNYMSGFWHMHLLWRLTRSKELHLAKPKNGSDILFQHNKQDFEVECAVPTAGEAGHPLSSSFKDMTEGAGWVAHDEMVSKIFVTLHEKIQQVTKRKANNNSIHILAINEYFPTSGWEQWGDITPQDRFRSILGLDTSELFSIKRSGKLVPIARAIHNEDFMRCFDAFIYTHLSDKAIVEPNAPIWFWAKGEDSPLGLLENFHRVK